MSAKSKLIFTLDGTQTEGNPEEPVLEEMAIALEWASDISEAEVTTPNFKWAEKEATRIKKFIDTYTRLQGMGLRIGVTDGTQIDEVFDGFLDLRTAKFNGCTNVEVDAEKRHSNGYFAERAQAISFESLYQDGFITNQDFVYIPYVLNYIPDGVQVMIISLTLFMMSKELYESIERFQKAISEAVKTIPDIIAGPAVEVLKVGQIAAIILQLVFQLAYIVAIIIAIVKLIKDLIEQFFPPLKYYAGIKYKTLWKAALNKMGLEFESTIYDDPVWGNSLYMPFKDEPGTRSPNGQTGYPNAQDPLYTFAALIQNEKNKYNAKYKITDGVLRFERWDYWQDEADYELPNVVSDQELGDDVLMDNSNEFAGLYNINFGSDPQDRNTVDNYKGTNCLISTQLNVVKEEDFRLDNGGIEILISEARGKRKDELTDFEKNVRGLLRFVDLLTGVLGNGTNFVSKVDNRVGAMNLSAPLISVPKMLIVIGNKLQFNQEKLVNARKLWDEFHYINSFDPINEEHYQYWMFNDVEIPFCFDDWKKVLKNNFFKTKDGKKGELLRLEWFVDGGGAKVNYRIKKKGGEIDTNYVTNIYEGE